MRLPGQRLATKGANAVSGIIRHPLSRDAFRYALSKVVPGLAGLFSVLLFIKVVGSDEYGKFAFWFALVAMASSFCGSWLNQAQLRYAGSELARSGDWALAIVVATVLAVVAVECFVLSGLLWFERGTSTAKGAGWIYGLAAAALVVHMVRVASLQAQMQVRQVLRIEILRGLLGLALPLGIAWWLRADHLGLLAGLAAAYFISVGQSIRPFRVIGQPEGRVLRLREVLAQCWRYGWPLSVWTGVQTAFPVVDRFLMQHFLGYAATGQYAAIYDLIVRSYSLVFFPVVMAAHPRIMAAANAGREAESLDLIRRAVVVQALLFAPMFVALAVGGNRLVAVVLPEGAEVPLGVILALALSGFLWQISLLAHKTLEIRGRVDIMLFAMAVALAVNAGVAAWGALDFGLAAFATASVLASTIYIALSIGLGRRAAVRLRVSVQGRDE